MFTFRKAKRIFEKIRKPERSKKGENALQRIRNMLDKGATLAKSTDSTIYAQKITVLLSTACHRNIPPFLQQSLK